MERHQAGQEEALAEVRVETDRSGAAGRPRGSPARRCPDCTTALATAMGLVIAALVVGFILHFSVFAVASCNQDSHAPNAHAKFNVTCKPKKSSELGTYDVLTVRKTASYLIYGEVKNVTSDFVALVQTWNGQSRTIQTKSGSERDVFLLDRVRLSNGTSVSVDFESTHPDSCRFFLYEL